MALRCKVEHQDFLQILARAIVSLDLDDRTSICDTVSSMVSTQLGAKRGATFLVSRSTLNLEMVSSYDFGEKDVMTSPEAMAVWKGCMDRRGAYNVDGNELNNRWADHPDFMAGGFAVMSIDIADRPQGVMIFLNDRKGSQYSKEDLELLSTISGIMAMTIENADSQLSQKKMILKMEVQSRERDRMMAEMEEKLELIRRQQEAISELSTPIIKIWDGVLTLPVIGVVDSRRSEEMMESLLEAVVDTQSRCIIIDITGVNVVDTKTADHFLKMVKAIRLLGSECILTGISPEIAQTLTNIGVDLSQIRTLRNLQDGLKMSFEIMKSDSKKRSGD